MAHARSEHKSWFNSSREKHNLETINKLCKQTCSPPFFNRLPSEEKKALNKPISVKVERPPLAGSVNFLLITLPPACLLHCTCTLSASILVQLVTQNKYRSEKTFYHNVSEQTMNDYMLPREQNNLTIAHAHDHPHAQTTEL